jgi:hypothetical protein
MSGLDWIREKTEYEKRSKVKLPDLIDKLGNEVIPLIEAYPIGKGITDLAALSKAIDDRQQVLQTLEHALCFLDDLAALHDGSIDFRR